MRSLRCARWVSLVALAWATVGCGGDGVEPRPPTNPAGAGDAGGTALDAGRGPLAEVCNGFDDDQDGLIDELQCPASYPCAHAHWCICRVGFIRCGDRCIDTRQDPTNCGGCGQTCGDGATCVGSNCVCPDASTNEGVQHCDGGCVDTRADPQNCGRCGRACGPGQRCVQGLCACLDGGLRACGQACVDTRADSRHCGQCDTSCGASQACVAGACACVGAGLSVCGAECVSMSSDVYHCGRCGNRCAPGHVCRRGACECERAGMTLCAGACTDLAVDHASCGMCGRACGAGTVCGGGRCLPRPVAPMSGARVAGAPLVFRWERGAARVQVCADRACTRVVRTLSATELEARMTEPLVAGVYFWRVQSPDGAASSSVAWSLRVDARRIARVGLLPPFVDLDGDGLADVVTLTDHGARAAVFFGSRTRLADTPDVSAGLPRLASGRGTIEVGGDVDGAGFQWVRSLRGEAGTSSVGWVGGRANMPTWRTVVAGAHAVFDVNGDGWSDQVGLVASTGYELGAWFTTGPNGARAEVTLREDVSLSSVSVAGVGDVNGDGFSDVVVGAPTYVPPRAWLYFGSSAGLDQSQLLPVAPRSDGFGETVSPAGDVNGDGFADVLVRARRVGAAVYLGGASITLHRWLTGDAGADVIVSRAGDVNGDGYGDVVAVLVGRGEARLHLGSATGLPETPVALRGPAWAAVESVGAPGDVDGDGFDDVVVGAPSVSEVRVLHGAAPVPLTRAQTLRGVAGTELGSEVL